MLHHSPDMLVEFIQYFGVCTAAFSSCVSSVISNSSPCSMFITAVVLWSELWSKFNIKSILFLLFAWNLTAGQRAEQSHNGGYRSIHAWVKHKRAIRTKFGSKPKSSFMLVIKLMAPKMKLLLSVVMGGFNPRTFMDDWSVHRDFLPTEMTSNERYITLYFQLSNVSLRIHGILKNLVNGEL